MTDVYDQAGRHVEPEPPGPSRIDQAVSDYRAWLSGEHARDASCRYYGSATTHWGWHATKCGKASRHMEMLAIKYRLDYDVFEITMLEIAEKEAGI